MQPICWANTNQAKAIANFWYYSAITFNVAKAPNGK